MIICAFTAIMVVFFLTVILRDLNVPYLKNSPHEKNVIWCVHNLVCVESGREREVISRSSAARLLAPTDWVCWGNICCAEWAREREIEGKRGRKWWGRGRLLQQACSILLMNKPLCQSHATTPLQRRMRILLISHKLLLHFMFFSLCLFDKQNWYNSSSMYDHCSSSVWISDCQLATNSNASWFEYTAWQPQGDVLRWTVLCQHWLVSLLSRFLLDSHFFDFLLSSSTGLRCSQHGLPFLPTTPPFGPAHRPPRLRFIPQTSPSWWPWRLCPFLPRHTNTTFPR